MDETLVEMYVEYEEEAMSAEELAAEAGKYLADNPKICVDLLKDAFDHMATKKEG